MDPNIKKQYINHLKQGNFVDAYDIIYKNVPIPLTDKIGCNTLVIICHGLLEAVNGKDADCQVDKAVELINLIDLTDLKQEYLLTVLESLCFILRSFIKCKNLSAILRIQKHLFPPLTGITLNEKEKKMLQSISEMLHNAMVRNSDYRNINKLIKLVAKCTVKSKNDLKHLMNFLLKHYKSNVENCLEFFEIIDLLTGDNKDLFKDKEFIQQSFTIVMILCEKLIYAKEVMKKFIEFLRKTPGIKLCGVLTDLLFLFDSFDNYPKNFEITLRDGIATIRKLYATNTKFYVENYALLLVNSLCNYKNGYRNIDGAAWLEVMNCDGLNEFLNLCKLMGEIVVGIKDQCDCCKVNYKATVVIYSFILPASVTYNMLSLDTLVLSDDYLKKLLLILKQGCKHVEVLKINKCKRLKYAWDNIGIHFYNLCVKLHKSKLPSSEFISILMKWSYKIEGSDCKPFNESAMHYLIAIYMETYFKNGDYNTALKLAALHILLYPDNNASALCYWMKSKDLLGEEMWNKTVVNVYNSNISYYKSISSHFEVIKDSDLKKSILLNELNGYLKQWPKRDCLLAGLNELYEISDALTVAEIIIRINLKDVIVMDSKMILKKCIVTLGGGNELIKGCLQYLYYRNDTYQTFNEVLVKNKSEDDNIKEQCELSFYAKQYRYLRDGFINIKKGIVNQYYDIIKILIDMAYIHKLNCSEAESIETWSIIYKLAKIDNDIESIIKSSGFILTSLKVTDKLFKTHLSSKNLQTDNNITLLLFYTNLSFAYLRNGLITELKLNFELATKYYYTLEDKQGDLEVDTARIYYMLLESNLTNIPCKHSVYKHDELIIKPYLAYKILKNHLTLDTVFKTPFLSVVYFELIDFMLQNYNWMRMPRELKCYGEDSLHLAQNSLLTFQTARILNYLAKADVFTCLTDDCRLKLDKISQLLTVKSNIDDLTDGIQKIYLTSQSYAATTGSPVLYTKGFSLPKSIYHENGCDCIPCNNPFYDQLFLQLIQLEALLSECLDNETATTNYYQAITDYTNLSLKKHQANTIQPTLDSIKLDQIKHNLRKKNYSVGKELNEELLLRLNKDPCKNYFLYNEILNLQLSLLINFNYKSEDIIKTPEKILTQTPKFTKSPQFKIYTPMIRPKIKLEAKTCSKIPLSYDRPVSPKIEKKLNKLTMELKSEQKSEYSMDERNERSKRAVRKNLLSELEDEVKVPATRTKRLVNKLKTDIKKEKVPDIVVSDENCVRTTRRNVVKKNDAFLGAVPRTTRRKL